MKYRIEKTLEISCAHSLELPYPSKCSHVHGHNWTITVVCETDKLNSSGMVVDFDEIKRVVMRLDHGNLNEMMEGNPTAERIGEWIGAHLSSCKSVRVQESQGNVAIVTAG